MASIFTRNGHHYAQFDDAARTPKRRRLSLGTKDKRLAAKLLARAEEAYRLGTFDPWTDPLSVCEPDRPAAPITVGDAVSA